MCEKKSAERNEAAIARLLKVKRENNISGEYDRRETKQIRWSPGDSLIRFVEASCSEEPFFHASSARKHVYTSFFERFKKPSGKLAIPKIREQIGNWRFTWAERKNVMKSTAP